MTSQMAAYHEQTQAAHEQADEENKKMRECLEKIRDLDYRGNRETGSVMAFSCLKEIDNGKASNT